MNRNHKFANQSISLLLIVGVIATLSMGPSADGADKTENAKPPCCIEELRTKPAVSDTSLYQIDSTWTTDTGKVIKLASLAGRPQVITMFFAQCEYACPILANDMRQLEAALPSEIRTKVGFVLITFDTERDTPKALAEYRKTRSIPNNWTLLTAEADDILELSQLLGVKFKKDARGQFAHSNVITILNAQGDIALQQTGLNRDPSEGVTELKRLMKKLETKANGTPPNALADTKCLETRTEK